MKKINLNDYIETHTLRCEASRRGGGIEIDAEEYVGIEGAKMTAYQNYLGGGLLGAVQSSWNFETKNKAKHARAEKLAEALKRYFHNITNEEAGEYDEWNAVDYEKNQAMPQSAY